MAKTKRRDHTKCWQRCRKTRGLTPTAGKVNWYTTSKKKKRVRQHLLKSFVLYDPNIPTLGEDPTEMSAYVHEKTSRWRVMAELVSDSSGLNCVPHGKLMSWSSNPKMAVFGESALKEVTKVRWGREGEIDPTGPVSLSGEGAAAGMHVQSRDHVGTREEEEGGRLRAKERGPHWNQPRWHLDLGLLVYGTA